MGHDSVMGLGAGEGERLRVLEGRVEALEREVARLRGLVGRAEGDAQSSVVDGPRPVGVGYVHAVVIAGVEPVAESVPLVTREIAQEVVAEAGVGAAAVDAARGEKVDEVVQGQVPVVQQVDERGYRYSPEEMAVMARGDAGGADGHAVSLVERLAARGVGMRAEGVMEGAGDGGRALRERSAHEGEQRAGQVNEVGAVGKGVKRKGEELSASLEQAIGGRWYALIGAVIVLIGLGLFLKLAVDQGWLSFSPVARCVMVALAGFGLIGGGEWAMRKASRFAAAGFSAAGVGALIAAVWAAERLYGLLGDGPAFVVLAGACAIGVGVAARSGLASVAVVSLMGAYLNPIIVGAESDDSRGFMAYLLLLLATGLVLPWWKGRAFAGVRSLAWWGTMLLGSVACGAEIVSGRAESAIVFAVVAWGMVHVELMSSAGRFGFGFGSALGRRELAGGDADGAVVLGELSADERMTFGEVMGSKMTGPSVKRAYFNARPLMASFSSTAWATVFVSFALQRLNVQVWLAPGGFLAATLACAHVLSGHLRYLKDVPKTDGERLGVSLTLQAGSLLIATVALALSGSAQSVAWVGMGVGAVAAGRWIRARGLDGYGLVVLAIALVRVLVFDRFSGAGATTAIDVAGLELGVWNVIAMSCGAGVIGASWLTRREANATWKSVGSVVAGAGVIAMAIALVGTTRVGPGVVAVVGMMGCAAGGMGMWYRSKGLGVLGVAMSVFAVGVLAPIGAMVGQRGGGAVSSGFVVAGLAFGAWFAAGVLCAVSIGVQGWMVRERMGAWRSVSNVLVAFAVVVMACAPIVQTSAGPAWMGVAAIGGVCAMWLSRRLGSESLALTGIALLLGGLVLGPIAGGWRDEGVTQRMLGGVVMSGWVAGYLVLAGAWGIGRALVVVVGAAGVEGADERGQGTVDAGGAGVRAVASDRVAQRAKEVVLSSGMVLAAMMAPVHPESWGGSMCVWWVAVGVAAVAASVRTQWTELVIPGLCAIGGATCAWLWSYGHVWNGWERDAGPILLSGGLWSGLLVAAGMGASAWMVRGARERLDWWVSMSAGRLVTGLATCTVVMLWLSTSMEAGRVGEIVSQERTFQRAAVSVWWGLFGLGLITAGFLWRGKEGAGVATARRAGLGMVAVAVLKALAWDLTQVSAIARVISFVGLGLLMMAVTVVYAKLAGRGKENTEGTGGAQGHGEREERV